MTNMMAAVPNAPQIRRIPSSGTLRVILKRAHVDPGELK
jgi:hypothetical protein